MKREGKMRRSRENYKLRSWRMTRKVKMSRKKNMMKSWRKGEVEIDGE